MVVLEVMVQFFLQFRVGKHVDSALGEFVKTKTLCLVNQYGKTYKDFSSSSGDLVKQGWAAVHSTADTWSTFLAIELHCTSFLCCALH